MLKPLALAGLLVVPTPGGSGPADPGLPPPCACSCSVPIDPTSEATIAAEYEGAGAVFVGRVVAHNQYRSGGDPDGDGPLPPVPPPPGDSRSPYFFVVEERFKGPPQQLFGAFNDPMCGLGGLDVGAVFLVYTFGGTDRHGRESHWLSMCSRSRAVGDERMEGGLGSLEAEVAVLRRLAAAED